MYKVVVYQDKKKEWRWTCKAKNGKVVADCSEGYKTKAKCLKMIDKLSTAAFLIEEKE